MLRLLCLSLVLGLALADDLQLMEDLLGALTERDDHHDDNVRYEILETLSRYEKNVEQMNIEGVMAMYLPDAIVMVDGYTMHGLQDLASSLGWISKVAGVKVQADQIQAMGEDAEYVMLRSRFQVVGNDGSIVKNGKSLTIWKKTPEGYKIYVDMNINTIPTE